VLSASNHHTPVLEVILDHMANFSGAVKIGDLNDFIAPSQACVLNLDGSAKAHESAGRALVRPDVPVLPVTSRYYGFDGRS
jgi:hypothetical protein